MSETQAHVLPSGFRIDEYEIVRVLGAGGFGITYLAFDHNLAGPVAIKEYFPDVAVRTDGLCVAAAATRKQEAFDWGLDRFLKEAQAIHRLRHPSIVRVHRYVQRHGTACIVMEYVEGESLASILESRGRLPADEWRPWLDRLLDGLAHVHDHDYLHRDIKPANIVIRAADGEPVLIDFGAARVASQQRTHTQVLTPGYAPFKQHTSEGTQGPPTDIYALAAVSFRVLAGTPPPTAPDRMLNDRYEPLAGRVAGVAPGWLAAIDHGLALRPDDRPQTVAKWQKALRRGEDKEPLTAAAIDILDEKCRRGDEQALRDLLDEANAGNPDAMVTLAGMIEDETCEIGRWYNDEAKDILRRPGDLQAVPLAAPMAWYRKAADLGHAGAQYKLGLMYDSTYEAAEWFHKAAAQGHVDAHFELGDLYREGEEAAEAWYRKAAGHGHVAAQYILGRMYASGCGDSIPQDSAEAVAWFQKAANQGHVGAQFKLGEMYSCGEGVPPDYDEVHAKLTMTWYLKAADQGHAEAQYNLGRMYESGCEGSVSQDSEQAVASFQKAASQGHVKAQFELGHMYFSGGGVPEDDEAAVAWYRKAASQGHPGAQHYLGEMYDGGWGVLKDAVEAVAWYRKAAQRGDGVYSRAAQLALGNMYRTGNDVPTDAAEAIAWYRKAAAEGDLTARFALGEMYARGEGVMRNPEAAVTWFRRDNTIEQTVPVPLDVGPWVAFKREKADNGDARAQFDLGWMCHHGKGVPADAATAAAWYRKAADQGDARAQFNLGVMYTLREGVPRDLLVAHMWFDVASMSTATGQRTLFDGGLHESALAAMEAIEGDMTASEIAEATCRAVTCRALKGDMTASEIAEATRRAVTCRALKGLNEIMKPDANNVRSGFTDEQYQQAQPLFTAAWVEWCKRWPGRDEDFNEYLATYLIEEHALPIEAACDMVDRFQQGQ